MDKEEDIQVTETVADMTVRRMADEKDGPEFTREYLKAGFLSSAVDALFYARREAGLTQAQVAGHLNTKQAAIARLEADTDGSMSLRRYVDFALACGMVPLDITFVPIDSLRDYVIAHPEAERTQDLYSAWLMARSESVTACGDTVQVAGDTASPASTKAATLQMANGLPFCDQKKKSGH